jgi:hypothetical protein|tara:strand:+ start:450 stop:560 length:111 start_codon:yes stop_codon:yes gene_type:complete
MVQKMRKLVSFNLFAKNMGFLQIKLAILAVLGAKNG